MSGQDPALPGRAARIPDAPAAEDPRRWRILGLLAVAELLGMSLWFAANAVAPQLTGRWEIPIERAGWLTAIVQLGFVAGTAVSAVLNLGDLLPARRLFAISALLGAAANAALVGAPDFGTALALRFLIGFFLAGVYPPAMKMTATWFRSQRGLAIGTVVGALTIGKATPFLVHAVQGATVAQVLFIASAGAVLAAALVALGYREGPFPFARRPFAWSLVATVARHRETRLAIGGYLGHMWELYAMWTWLPAFLAASIAAAGASSGITPAVVDLLTFGAIAAGALGCVWGGWASTTAGYARVVTWSMAVSGTCCVLAALVFGGPWWLLIVVTWIWGFFVVADSAQFSAMVTEAAPPHAVGTALMLQTSIGFLLTMATIQLVPAIAAGVGWRWAFPVLALGPALGIAAIARLGARFSPGRSG
jgi:MFS family permease